MSSFAERDILGLSKLAVSLGKIGDAFAGQVNFLKQLAAILNANKISTWVKFQDKSGISYQRLFIQNTDTIALVRDKKILKVSNEAFSEIIARDYHLCSSQNSSVCMPFHNNGKNEHDTIVFSIDAEQLYVASGSKLNTGNSVMLKLIAGLFKQNKHYLMVETAKCAQFFSFAPNFHFKSREAYFSIDTNDYNLLGISPSIENITGQTPEKLLKEPLNQLFSFYSENSIKDLVQQVLKDSTVSNFYIEIIDVDDNIKYCTIDATLKQNGNSQVIEGVITDRSDYFLMKQEKDRLLNKMEVLTAGFGRYEVAIDSNPMAIIFCNLKGKIIYANLAFLRMTRYNYKEVIGKTPAILNSGYHEREYYEKMWRTLKSGLIWSSEIYDKKKNGQNFWASLTISPIRNEKGTLREFIAIYNNIDKKNEMENLLTRARMEAESANIAKSEFLATMSHEIRNPLNAIVGNIDFLKQTELDDKQKEIVRRALVSSESLLHIISDILDFSKIESGQLVIERKPFNLKETFFDLARTMEPKSKEKNLTLQTEFDEVLDVAIMGDQYRLMQIFFNLVSNAIKFTSQGYVKMSCSKQPPSNSRLIKVLFVVEDTGIGIASDKLDSVFEKFKQEDQSITRKYGGTGLGLAISKQLTQLMGGNLFVESVKNQGSNFYFILEFEKTAKQKASPAEKDYYSYDRPNILERKKVLVVDDLEFNVDVATMLLKSWGATCYTAFDGEQAVELLKNNKEIDMVLMDFRMPVMDGLNATRIIRNDLNLSIPIIGLTGEVVKEKIDESFSVGMNDYIIKPFKRKNLLIKILKYLK